MQNPKMIWDDTMLFLEGLYSELDREKRLTLPKSRTCAFYNFNLNVERALMLPTLKYGPETDDDWAFLDSAFLHQAAITQIITSLETYYRDVLKTISENVKISEVDAVSLSRFIKENRLMTEFIKALKSEQTLNFYLSKLIPEFFPLQQKERIKIAMELIGLDPVGPFKQEWERTFGDDEKSTIKLRHAFVHRGIDCDKMKLDMSFIKDRIKDALVLVCNLEKQINKKYPIRRVKKLYPKESILKASNPGLPTTAVNSD